MKKLIGIVLAAVLVLTAHLSLVACSQKGSDEPTPTPASTNAFATLGDVFAAEPQSTMSTFDEHRYACAFSLDGTWWHVEAELPEGMSDELNEVWNDDQAKVEELLSPLAVTIAETLEAPTEDEVATFVGKTGAELSADGFTFMQYGMVVNGSETDCSATRGSFDYLVTFDGAVPDEDTDDPAGAVADMTVSSISLQGVSWNILDSSL